MYVLVGCDNYLLNDLFVCVCYAGDMFMYDNKTGVCGGGWW